MRDNAGVPVFVGRSEPLARLTAAYRACTAPNSAGWAGLVLVTGEGGIGKTALLTRFAAEVAAEGATVLWGTCWDGDLAPAWWPWTQALRSLLEQRQELAEGAAAELAAVVPALSAGAPAPSADNAARVRVFDAAGQVLRRAAAHGPVVVVLDDLHQADQSTVDLLRFLAHQPHTGALLLVGAYRPHEPAPAIAAGLAALATVAELIPLRGLTADEMGHLVRAVAGAAAQDHWTPLVHERSGGHPFYARELCRVLAATGTATEVPAAVREVIARRLAVLSPRCAALLDAAAVAGGALRPDVMAEVTGEDTTAVAGLAAEAIAAAILAPASDVGGEATFVHDLYRDAIYASLDASRRLALHHRVAGALLRRHERGSPVFPAELAHHHTAAIAVAGIAPAVHWTHVAARADAARFAFVEAAGHLTRLRSAVVAAGAGLPDAELVGLLTAEADFRLRSGDAVAARELLDMAWSRATATASPELLAAVAMGLDRVDARFAMPRSDLINALDTAREALSGEGSTTEAAVTAALARQLQHSVIADRPRARPLAEQAVSIARTLDDPATLASCLLAQHDVLWTPGTAAARAALAAEIAELAKHAGDPERQAQALLLSATAQLENASPAFRATLTEYTYLTGRLRQPRHDYLLRTRQAALALLDGEIDAGERLSAEAAVLGEAVGEGDTGNVRMSQRLEVVRARHLPEELREMAAEAVRWWVGAPAHAHAVAAGFCARAGDLAAARQHLDTVLTLEDWRTDRSYLWSIFVGEMATAAIALDDRPLCQQLLDDLLPLAGTCAVNAALVCFMGAHAHRVGLLYAALGQPGDARRWLDEALDIHRRLGARAWLAETQQALTSLDDSGAASPSVQLHRAGDMWRAGYLGLTVYLRDSKGMHDLAALLARPGADIPALTLAGGEIVGEFTEPVLDRTALHAYRRRLSELEEELDTAHINADLARQQRAVDEREQVLAELRRATRPGGASRPLSPTAAERARKAVTARLRDTIKRIAEAHPGLGAHLDRSIRTGTVCRYEP